MGRKIRVIVPNTTSEFNEDIAALYESIKVPGTQIDVTNISGIGSRYIDQTYDKVWSELSVLREAEKAEADGYDAVLVYCALDPARDAMREALSIPVVSIFEVGIHTAAMLGHHISILSPPGSPVSREALITRYHMESLYVSTEFFDLGIGEVAEDINSTYGIVKTAAEEALKKGADCLVFGCGALMGIAARLSREMGVPVIEPGLVAIKYCEALIDLGLGQSKKTYSRPADHERNCGFS